MSELVIEGLWEEVVREHAEEFQGCRVTIRRADQAQPTLGEQSWAGFSRAVGGVTRGRGTVSDKIRSTEDIYDQAE